MQTFFILGSHPDLAKAEILSVVGSDSKILLESSAVLILDSVTVPLEDLQNRLGGTIKIGVILDEYLGADARACGNAIIEKAKEATGKNKITFGFSAYDLGNPKAVQRIMRTFKVLGSEIKQALKETERPVRFVQAIGEALTSVVVDTNGLCESGGEFCMFATETSIILGRTSTVQDFKAWSDRDFGRPARDSRSGMLPPKLARMMINLSGANPSSSTILDPFCGSGTIPMEAALMGFTHIIGSDISEKAIRDSRVNTSWLYEKKFLHPITPKEEIEFHVSKAEEIQKIITNPVDAIVAETYLGPPKHEWDRPALEALKAELMKMYRDSLGALSKKLKANGTIVIAFPAFVVNNEIIKLPLKKAIEEAGLTLENAWMYRRPDQMTAREIVRMKKRTS
jgi:tRNA G10  N-methylase Trm11